MLAPPPDGALPPAGPLASTDRFGLDRDASPGHYRLPPPPPDCPPPPAATGLSATGTPSHGPLVGANNTPEWRPAFCIGLPFPALREGYRRPLASAPAASEPGEQHGTDLDNDRRGLAMGPALSHPGEAATLGEGDVRGTGQASTAYSSDTWSLGPMPSTASTALRVRRLPTPAGELFERCIHEVTSEGEEYPVSGTGRRAGVAARQSVTPLNTSSGRSEAFVRRMPTFAPSG